MVGVPPRRPVVRWTMELTTPTTETVAPSPRPAVLVAPSARTPPSSSPLVRMMPVVSTELVPVSCEAVRLTGPEYAPPCTPSTARTDGLAEGLGAGRLVLHDLHLVELLRERRAEIARERVRAGDFGHVVDAEVGVAARVHGVRRDGRDEVHVTLRGEAEGRHAAVQEVLDLRVGERVADGIDGAEEAVVHGAEAVRVAVLGLLAREPVADLEASELGAELLRGLAEEDARRRVVELCDARLQRRVVRRRRAGALLEARAFRPVAYWDMCALIFDRCSRRRSRRRCRRSRGMAG